MKSEPLILKRYCAICRHFDGEGWCALRDDKLIRGYIAEPVRVVCEKHEPLDPDA